MQNTEYWLCTVLHRGEQKIRRVAVRHLSWGSQLPPECNQPVLAHLLPSNPNTFFRNFFLSFFLSSFLPRCRPFTPSRFPTGRASLASAHSSSSGYLRVVSKPVVATGMNQDSSARRYTFTTWPQVQGRIKDLQPTRDTGPLSSSKSFTRTIGDWRMKVETVQVYSPFNRIFWNSYVIGLISRILTVHQIWIHA